MAFYLMFNGNMSYEDVLEMPTDMRLNYIQYVSDQYKKKKNSMTDKVKDMNPQRGEKNSKSPFANNQKNS